MSEDPNAYVVHSVQGSLNTGVAAYSIWGGPPGWFLGAVWGLK